MAKYNSFGDFIFKNRKLINAAFLTVIYSLIAIIVLRIVKVI